MDIPKYLSQSIELKKHTYIYTYIYSISTECNVLQKFKKTEAGTCLVAQWVRIRLPMQGTRVQSLVWEDSTCCGATKPMHHNC